MWAEVAMTSKERFLTAIGLGKPDRLPVTTHHVMPYFLDKYMSGVSNEEFFAHFGFDPITWVVPHRPDESGGEYYDPDQGEIGFLESRRIAADAWRIRADKLENQEYDTVRYTITTPGGELTTTLQSNAQTVWVTEHLVKEKRDIDIIGEYATAPKCDVTAVNAAADQVGDTGLLRGHICCFDLFGQPGCWQDACCLYGAENMIMATFDDPEWAHTFLRVLQKRKLIFAESLAGARYDILELGGGDASTTVISPKLFEEFVVPYDREVIATAHRAGQRIAYHTCGGMMPILEDIAGMEPDAMETFTPAGMGADVDLAEAKTRIGDKVCMIGGFDQFHFFQSCSERETRAEVRRCFQAAGAGGGYIISPSDHFFDADPALIEAFVDEARECRY